jgi:hypothetical protein
VPRSDTAKSARDAALAVLVREVQYWIYARRERRLGLVMRSLLAVAFAALTSAASAQPTTIPNSEPAASAFGPDPIIQIETTFRARIEGLADPRDVPSTPAQDTARRTLYNMAANECRVLSEFWKAECRLNSFSVYVPVARIVGPDELPQVPSMFGTAVYELRLTSPGH